MAPRWLGWDIATAKLWAGRHGEDHESKEEAMIDGLIKELAANVNTRPEVLAAATKSVLPASGGNVDAATLRALTDVAFSDAANEGLRTHILDALGESQAGELAGYLLVSDLRLADGEQEALVGRLGPAACSNVLQLLMGRQDGEDRDDDKSIDPPCARDRSLRARMGLVLGSAGMGSGTTRSWAAAALLAPNELGPGLAVLCEHIASYDRDELTMAIGAVRNGKEQSGLAHCLGWVVRILRDNRIQLGEGEVGCVPLAALRASAEPCSAIHEYITASLGADTEKWTLFTRMTQTQPDATLSQAMNAINGAVDRN